MKSLNNAGVLLSAALLYAGSAYAGDNYVYGTVGGADSIGFGHIINDNFSVRADIGHESSLSNHKTLGENRYDNQSDSATTFNIMADWFPITGSGFRLSGGIGYNNDQKTNGNAAADASGNYHINGGTYSSATVGQLRADSSYRALMPELGIGWESTPAGKEGWRFISGLNLQLMTGGSTTLELPGTSGNPALQQNLAIEQQHASSDFGSRSWRLNLMIGAAYTF